MTTHTPQLQSAGFQTKLSVRQITALLSGQYGVRTAPGAIPDGLADTGLGGQPGRRFQQLSGGLLATHSKEEAHGEVILEDVFIGLTGGRYS